MVKKAVTIDYLAAFSHPQDGKFLLSESEKENSKQTLDKVQCACYKYLISKYL